MRIENTLTDDNRAARASLIGRGERDEPFLFVGRERIFKDIEEQLRQVNEKGMSFDNAAIIQGPPGSGKTSVLRELRYRYDATAQVIPVHLDGHQLSDGFSVAKTFLKSSGFERLLQQQATQKWIHGHLGDKHIGLKTGYETTAHAFRQGFKDGEFVWDVLEECLDAPPGTTFLVLIDEAQQVTPDISDNINRIAITYVSEGYPRHLHLSSWHRIGFRVRNTSRHAQARFGYRPQSSNRLLQGCDFTGRSSRLHQINRRMSANGQTLDRPGGSNDRSR